MNIALILAGGSGSRMGAETPKQFLPLEGRQILLRVLDVFQAHPEIGQICVVSGEEWSGRLKYLMEQEGYGKVCGVVDGGQTRRESSFRGLSFLMERFSPDDIVLIHDAARPLVSGELISESIRCARRFHACTAAIPLQDTVLESSDGRNTGHIPDRKRLYAVQTPQAFRLGTIFEGHRRFPAGREVTDDAGILAAQGINVKLVPGEKRNLKITSPEDMLIAAALLKG